MFFSQERIEDLFTPVQPQAAHAELAAYLSGGGDNGRTQRAYLDFPFWGWREALDEANNQATITNRYKL